MAVTVIESPGAVLAMSNCNNRNAFQDTFGNWLLCLGITWWYSTDSGKTWTQVASQPATNCVAGSRGYWFDRSANAIYVCGHNGLGSGSGAAFCEKLTWDPALKTLTRNRSTGLFTATGTISVDGSPCVIKDLDGRILVISSWRDGGSALGVGYAVRFSTNDAVSFSSGTWGATWNNRALACFLDEVTGHVGACWFNASSGQNIAIARMARGATAFTTEATYAVTTQSSSDQFDCKAVFRTSDNRVVIVVKNSNAGDKPVVLYVWDSTAHVITRQDIVNYNASCSYAGAVRALGALFAIWQEGTTFYFKDISATADGSKTVLSDFAGTIQAYNEMDSDGNVVLFFQTNETNYPVRVAAMWVQMSAGGRRGYNAPIIGRGRRGMFTP